MTNLVLFTVLVVVHIVVPVTGCIFGRIDLRSIASTAFQATTSLGTTETFSLSLCTASATSGVAGLGTCSAAGYVLRHNSSKVCNQSYSVVEVPLAKMASRDAVNGMFRTAANDEVVNVMLVCNPQGTSKTASLREPVPITSVAGRRVVNLTLDSYDACSLDTTFCDGTTVRCRDSTRSCLNNVCVNLNCMAMSRKANLSTTPADVVTQLTVNDCGGTPVPGLGDSDFEVLIDGVVVGNTEGSETPVLVKQIPASNTVVVSTILLDQSSSVTSALQTALKKSATDYVKSTTISAEHYVGVFVFDGAATLRSIHVHSKDTAAIVAAIEALPAQGGTGTDGGSTNLYGASVLAAEECIRMMYSFGNTNNDVVGTVIMFTDGKDTSGRSAQSSAVARLNAIRAKATVYTFGVALTTSDTTALGDLAGSSSNVYVVETASSGLSTAFLDVARKLSLLTNNTYVVAACAPQRTGTHSVVVRLNSTKYTTSAPSTLWTFGADTLTGGCTAATLARHVPSTVSTLTVPKFNTTIGATSSFTTVLDAPYFFDMNVAYAPNIHLTLTSSSATTLTSTTTVYYTYNTTTCRVSLYCYTGAFSPSTGFSPLTGGAYSFMVLSNSTTQLAVSTAIGLRQSTPAPPGTTTTPGGTPAPPPAVTYTPDPRLAAKRRDYYGPLDRDAVLTLIIPIVVAVVLFILYLIYVFIARAFIFVPDDDNSAAMSKTKKSTLLRAQEDAGLENYTRQPALLDIDLPMARTVVKSMLPATPQKVLKPDKPKPTTKPSPFREGHSSVARAGSFRSSPVAPGALLKKDLQHTTTPPHHQQQYRYQ
eukprot:PhM_4_TR7755/c0_g1_i2/m.60955